MERRHLMLQRNRPMPSRARLASFDDYVNEEGKLKATGTDDTVNAESLRRRNAEASGAALGNALADPFSDEKAFDYNSEEPALFDAGPSAVLVLPSSSYAASAVLQTPTSSSVDDMLIRTDDTVSTHPSEAQLVDLTPTSSTPATPRRVSRADASLPPPSYQSIYEWAENSTTSTFHSFLEEPLQHDEGLVSSRTVSEAELSEAMSEIASIVALSEAASDLDMVSDPGVSTPGTWTEVGSVVSEEHHH